MKRSADPFVLFVVGAAALIALALYAVWTDAAPDIQLATSSLGSAAITAVCAVVVLLCAAQIGPREPWGRQWRLVGLGVVSLALAHGLFAVAEITGLAAVTWFAGIAALVEYGLVGAALVSVAEAYAPLVHVRRPAAGALLAGATALALLWFGLIGPYVLPDAAGLSEAGRIAFAPLADILLLLVPGTFVSLCLAQLGGSRFARPWYWLTAGATVMAVSHSAIIWQQAIGSYVPGAPLDYLPLLAQLLIAMGALTAANVAEEFKRPARVPASAGAQ